MGRFESFFAILILALMVTLMVAGGCSDNTCPPQICWPKPTLENIWPNDDQRFWEYEYTLRGWGGGFCDTLYDTEEEVPPVPSFDYVEDLLDNHPIGDDVNIDIGLYRMRFDGDSTNPSGVTAQALKDTLYLEGIAVSQDQGLGRRDIILGRIKANGSSMPDGSMWADFLDGYSNMEQFIDPRPYLIHGGIWEKNDEWIGTYCYIDTNLCWKFLEEDLAPGNEFTHQLIPALTDDTFLHCKVLRMTNIRMDGHVYPNALECVYILEYGPFAFRTPSGDPYGWCRLYDYGVVIYAPTVGPIYSYERVLVEAGDGESPGVGDRTLVLTDTGTKVIICQSNRGNSKYTSTR